MNKLFKSLSRIALSAAVVMAFQMTGGVSLSVAADYTVNASTHVPTESETAFTLGSYPNIANGAVIRNIIASNSGATAQVVSIYDTCTASHTAVLAGRFDLPAAIGAVQLPAGQAFLPNVFRLTNPCFKKSATASDVNILVLYE